MNVDIEKNENLINQEPDFITFGDHPEEDPCEISQEEPEEISGDHPEEDPEEISQEEPEEISGDHPEEDPEEISQEEPEEISEIQAETQVIDYSQDFLILENLGYIQISMIGALLFYFVLTLVIKFIKSFF